MGLLALSVGCGDTGEVEPPPPPSPAIEQSATEAPLPELSSGSRAVRHIAPGQAHEYRLELQAGDYFGLEVEQRGVDVGLALYDPRAELQLEMDLPTEDLGTEPLLGIAESTGSHRLTVEAWEGVGSGGSYALTVSAMRPAGGDDRLRAAAAREFYEGERLSWGRRHEKALAPYSRALELWRRLGDEFWQAETLDRLGSAYRHLGDSFQAAEHRRQAVRLFARLPGDPTFHAASASHLALDYQELGQLDRAVEWYQKALELQRRSGDRRGQGVSLGALANIYKIQGELQKALDSFEQALELLDRPQDRRYRAFQLHNLGTLYHRLGRREAALDNLRAAERAFAGLGLLRWQASSLSQIGQLALESGDSERALRTLGHALTLRQQVGDRRGEAVALRKIGSALLAGGDVEEARSRYLQALDRLRPLDRPRSEAALLLDLGELHSQLARGGEAVDYYHSALEIYERIGDPLGEARSLLGIATAERQRGELERALEPGRRALEIVEDLRLKPYSEELRISFFAAAQTYFDAYIDLLMEAGRADPAAGHIARALQQSERARSRSLLDLLSEAGAEIRDTAAPGLLEDERRIQRLLNRSVAVMEDENADDDRREAAAEEVKRAWGELDGIRVAIRRQSPRYAALTQPELVTVKAIQETLLDPETVLLEYRLGRERSYLWVVSAAELVSFVLAPRVEIEGRVRAMHELLQQGARRESQGRARTLLCELSAELLRPAAGLLAGRRLLIVPDGALEYLPFGALPEPTALDRCDLAEPLIVRHEIVHLPSASALAALRRDDGERRPVKGTIAMVADPVFGPDDERFLAARAGASPHPGAGEEAAARRGGQAVGTSWRRLPHSRTEAEAILSLVPPSSAFEALGFEATKKAVVSGRFAGYRIVHFATHAVVNAEQPALSGIVLSQVDRRGDPIDGLLRAHEVYNLKLSTDLVVLSACETALGKEVRGEGLVGLTRGFMYAGARRVVVSLWKVSDLATAELMRDFYRNLLVEDLAPAAALRAAQITQRGRRPHPFYWSGFILQGDWRPTERIG